MSKRHDENKDLQAVSRVCKIDIVNKHISAAKSANIGIRTWGRIDYLVNYCGWVFTFDNSVKVVKVVNADDNITKNTKRAAKKAAREQTLTNKKKK